jgi:hypothetical protein
MIFIPVSDSIDPWSGVIRIRILVCRGSDATAGAILGAPLLINIKSDSLLLVEAYAGYSLSPASI